MPSVVAPIGSEGPVVEVLIGLSKSRRVSLASAGRPLPSPVRARLLIDTGASTTQVVAGLLAPLGIAPSGSIFMHTPSTGLQPVPCDEYDVSILFPTAVPALWRVDDIAAAECQPLPGTIQGLIGRDILD